MNVLRSIALATAYSAVIYLAILLFRKLFSGWISASLQYGVWFLLVLRLLLPFTIDSGFSLITLRGPAAQVIETFRSGGALSPAAAGTALGWDLFDWSQAIWAAGAAASFAWLLAQYARLRRRVSRCGQPPDAAARGVYEKVKAELGIRRGPILLRFVNIPTPALTVGPKPALLLPPGAGGCTESEEELAHILRHELTHYRRGDHIVCLLLLALRCVYWFNPIVWLASRDIRLDMEISCDNQTVRNMDAAGKKRYAAMILTMFGRPGKPGLVMGLGMESNRKNIEKRIRGVFMKTKSKNAALFAAAAATMLLLIACFTTACVPTVGKASPPSVSAAISSPLPATAPPTPAPSQASPAPTMVAVYDASGNVVDYAYCVIYEDGGVVMVSKSLYDSVIIYPHKSPIIIVHETKNP